MKIRVNPHNVEIVREETEPINELEVKVSKCEFEFDEKITNEFVKEAYFTLNGSTYKQIIVNNECEYPNEVLTQTGTLEIGVVAYKVENGEELIRYNPSPDYYDTWVGSLKDAENTEPLTPTDKEQIEQEITNNANAISTLRSDVERDIATIDEKLDTIETGAEVNIIEDVKVNGTSLEVVDKSVDVPVPTKTNQLENNSGFITKDVNNLSNYTLKTSTGSLVDLEINGTTYVVTLRLKDIDGNVISTDSFDLPLESVVVGGEFDAVNKKIVLTLENGQSVDIPVGDLVAGLQTEITNDNKIASDLIDDSNSGNKFTNTTEKTTWNAKYDKPSNGIPKSDLSASVQESLNKADSAIQDVSDKEDKSNKVTEINSSSTDTQYPSAKCVYNSQVAQDTEIDTLKMIYNILPTDTDTGETISIDDTGEMPIKNIQLGGNTSQVVIPEEQGTSVSNTSIYVSDVNTDKEHTIEISGNTYQETTTGKNLLTSGSQYNDTASGITGSYNDETGEYTISGTASTTGNVQITTTQIPLVLSSGTTLTFSSTETMPKQIYIHAHKISGGFQNLSISANNKYGTYTLEDDIDYYNLRFSVENETAYNFTTKFQLETGSTQTDWEKFTYGASPNPSYPQDIEVVTGENDITIEGKNLFDKDDVENNKRLDASGQPITNNATGFSLTGYIKVKPNTQYTYSRNITSAEYYVNICEYTKDKTHIERLYKAGDTTTTYTFTTPNNCEYLRINDATTNLNSIQLEQGSTATTYEPYVSQTYPVNLGNIELCKISTYQDRIYKSNDKWYLEKNINKDIFDGSNDEMWNYESSTTTPTNRTVFAIYYGSNVIANNYYSNRFIYQSETSNRIVLTANSNKIYLSIDNQIADINTSDTNNEKLNKFINWLTNNNVSLYKIKNATTTEITDSTLVSQLNALANSTLYSTTNINTETSNLLPYIDLTYNVVTPSPSPTRPSVVNVVKGNNTIAISNSDNTESQSYPINLGNMELCKIGTYQDYIYESNGNWFKKGNIGKVVLNGSENWSGYTNSQGLIYFYTGIDRLQVNEVICNKLVKTNNMWTQATYENLISGSTGSRALNIMLKDEEINTVNKLLAWLPNNNLLVYYVLATPTGTQITDTTLITQLNNIKKAYSYDTQTNISQTNTDKPFIITTEMFLSLKNVLN